MGSLLEQWQEDKGLSITVYTNVMPDTKLEGVNEAVEQARAANCDAVIALGGGSVIDTAKVVNIALKFGATFLIIKA